MRTSGQLTGLEWCVAKSPKARRPRHVPQRTCVGCRQVVPKRSSVRIVRTPEGVRIDPSGKVPGRGAYLHNQAACWEVGLRGPLARALRVELSNEDRRQLLAYLEGLTDDPSGERQPA